MTGPGSTVAPPVDSPRLQAAARTNGRVRTGGLQAELLAALGAAVLATAIGAWVLQLWKIPLNVPLDSGGGDSLFNLVMIKDVITHGWDFTNPSLGAPFVEQLYDYPALNGDSFYMVIIKAMGVITRNPAIVMNAFFLIGFPLIAITTFGVLRKLGISAGVAIVCAVLYAVLPYRFESAEFHIFLSSYFTVPISCYLILLAFQGKEFFARDRASKGLRAYLNWRSAAMVVLCLVLGSADSYFAMFTVVLLASATLLAFLAKRGRRALVCGLLAATIILGAMALNELPTVIYDAYHGPNTVPSARLPQESDIWGLSLTNLVMPIENNRIPLLAELAYRYHSTAILPASDPRADPTFSNLGLVGTFGLLWLMIMLIAYCVRNEKIEQIDLGGVHAALGASMAFLIGTVGGLATIFAYIVTPQFHAPDRICVFIAFFAMFGAALGLDRLGRRIGARPRRRMIFPGILAIVLLIGVLYQTSPTMVPQYPPYAVGIKLYRARSQFVRAIEAQVPGNASIFEIPHFPFPQGTQPAGLKAYEDLYPYLFSERLRWTGGATEGRPDDWVPNFLKKPLPQVLEGISALNFKGIYVDTAGLPEHGTTFIPTLQRALDVTPVTSAEGRLVFFNMAPYNQRFRTEHSAAQIAGIAAAALPPRS